MKDVCGVVSTALIVVLVGCAVVANRYAPQKIDGAALSEGSGIILISTGAPEACNRAATFLTLQPTSASYGEEVLARLPVDFSGVKSDFPDHQGSLSALALKAGNYRVYPALGGRYLATKVPEAQFAVSSGEIVYLGEYFIQVPCTTGNVSTFRDRQERDLALLRQMNPNLASMAIRKRILRFTGYIIGDEK